MRVKTLYCHYLLVKFKENSGNRSLALRCFAQLRLKADRNLSGLWKTVSDWWRSELSFYSSCMVSMNFIWHSMTAFCYFWFLKMYLQPWKSWDQRNFQLTPHGLCYLAIDSFLQINITMSYFFKLKKKRLIALKVFGVLVKHCYGFF